MNQRLDASLAQFADRSLTEAFPYLILDARYERVREAGVIVGDDELDATEASPAQAEKEVLPGRAALAVGHFDGQDLAAPVPVDPDRDQHRLARDHAALAHLLITRIEDGQRALRGGAWRRLRGSRPGAG